MCCRVLLFLFFIGISSMASSQPISTQKDEPIEETNSAVTPGVDAEGEKDKVIYSSEQIKYLVDEQKVLLYGGARAVYGTVSIEAETLIFDLRKKEIIALGHPVLYDGDQTIYGKKMRYEIETGYGEVVEGRTAIEKGWFEGKKTRKVGKNILEIEGGKFTTCDRKPPHYFFAARRMKVYQDDMVITEPLLMYVGNVPVFFMPYWFFPIKKGRHSGFLIPKIGTDSYDGRYVKNLSYFLVLNDYSDIHFSFDILEKKGLRSGVEGVYVVKPYLEGRISGAYIDETQTNRKRWRVQASHRQNLGKKTDLRARADFQSDVDYEVDYNENRIVQLNRRLESYLSLTKTWSGAGVNLVANRTHNLDSDQISQLLPRASFNLSNRRIFESAPGESVRWYNRLRASFSTLMVNSREGKEGEYVDRRAADTRLNLSMPVTILGHLNVSPRLGFQETVYGRDTTSSSLPWRHHYTAAVAINTTLYGLSRFGVGPIERFRHVLKPSISYSYSPEVKDTFSYVPGIGGVAATNSFRASIGNDFQAKLGRGEGSSILNLASLDISGSYDLRRTGRRLSDIASYLRVRPVEPLEFDMRMSHNPYERKLTMLSATARLNLAPRGSALSRIFGGALAGNYVRNIADRSRDTYQVWGRVDFRPTDKWHVVYSQRYDVNDRKLIEQSVRVSRDLHAWEGQFEWQTFGDRWRYDVRISMKAIPEIKLGKGLFGIFLP
ncbi:LPS-assembly protein LptD [candidate division TA06 bacterium]|uniref:LPS-assembly protein LptD n=1 Tax=candidate division TA06 bacterium TaxID=2250710 RepID=A0A523UN99_UNCT6|nr:MAG: LPS-assembly protein LptD [candidate division TA06 bacterium]